MLSKRFGNGSKTMLLMWLVLCSACPPICWADVVLTDTEATALKMSLQTAKKELDEQEKQIEKLRSQLNGQKSELENARLQLEKSQTETRELQNNLTRLSTFWKEQKKEARVGKVKAWCIGAVLGAAGGFAGAWYMLR